MLPAEGDGTWGIGLPCAGLGYFSGICFVQVKLSERLAKSRDSAKKTPPQPQQPGASYFPVPKPKEVIECAESIATKNNTLSDIYNQGWGMWRAPQSLSWVELLLSLQLPAA